MPKYPQAPFSRSNVIFPEAFTAKLEFLPLGQKFQVNSLSAFTSPESATWHPKWADLGGLSKRTQEMEVFFCMLTCVRVHACVHTHTHAQWDPAEAGNVSSDGSPNYLGPWIGGNRSLTLGHLVWVLVNHLISVPKEYVSVSFDLSSGKTFRSSLSAKTWSPQGLWATQKPTERRFVQIRESYFFFPGFLSHVDLFYLKTRQQWH